jgi:hypothetical protein
MAYSPWGDWWGDIDLSGLPDDFGGISGWSDVPALPDYTGAEYAVPDYGSLYTEPGYSTIDYTGAGESVGDYGDMTDDSGIVKGVGGGIYDPNLAADASSLSNDPIFGSANLDPDIPGTTVPIDQRSENQMPKPGGLGGILSGAKNAITGGGLGDVLGKVLGGAEKGASKLLALGEPSVPSSVSAMTVPKPDVLPQPSGSEMAAAFTPFVPRLSEIAQEPGALERLMARGGR